MSHKEVWYCYRVLTIPRDEETGEAMQETPRLLVPWSNPNKHEFAFDHTAPPRAPSWRSQVGGP